MFLQASVLTNWQQLATPPRVVAEKGSERTDGVFEFDANRSCATMVDRAVECCVVVCYGYTDAADSRCMCVDLAMLNDDDDEDDDGDDDDDDDVHDAAYTQSPHAARTPLSNRFHLNGPCSRGLERALPNNTGGIYGSTTVPDRSDASNQERAPYTNQALL